PGQPGPGQPGPGQPDAPAGDQPAGQESATIGPVRIEYVEGLDVFVIRGNRGDVARVVQIIERIKEQSAETQPVIEVYQLRFANSAAVGALITELYDTVFAPRQSPVSITPLDKPNALLLIGQKGSVTSVAELIAKLDTPVAPDTQLRVFRLKHLSAIDAETTVRNFFVDRPGAGDTVRPGLGTRVRAIADYRTNSLLVQASPRDMAEIVAMMEKIDVESSESNVELRVFRLRNTLASDLVPVLQEAITGVPTDQQQAAAAGQAGVGATRAQSTRRSTNVSILSVDAQGNRLIQSAILADMVITADPNVNALLVRGPASGMDLMAELIRQLDQLPEAEAQIKVFALENGDATTLTALLQELFGQPVTAGQGALGQAFNVQLQNVQSLTGGGESSLVPLRFSVDVRTNSIVATGSRADLNVIEVLLLRLDEGGIESRKTEVYFLQNAPAQDVATAIQNFLANQRAITQQLFAFQAVTPFEQIDREVIVVPEIVTNSLIVSATPRYYDAIQKIIQDLDYRPPMVLVQVVLAAVALDDAFEFGVELGLQDSLLFDRGRSNIGYNFNNTGLGLGNDNTDVSNATRELLGGQSLTNFLLGRQSAQLGYGGLVLSAANESVNILMRALQDQGRLQVLARPQVMTLDNEEAFVQIGQRVPRITGSSTTPQGGTQSNVVDEPVGLLLRIRPRVNQQDVVVMTVDTERSEVDFNQGVPVSVDQFGNPVISPLIETITAQTTLSARSGQTVVFAGLIAKRRAVETRRVPYLSDVPILGHLFRFDSEVTSRDELMIFLTPHIVRNDQDIERLKQVESSRMSWCLADLVEMHGSAGLSGGYGLWNPPPTPTIYPYHDPTAVEVVPTPAAMPGPQFGPQAPAVPPDLTPADLLQPPGNRPGSGAQGQQPRPARQLDLTSRPQPQPQP
ncbi:MAG: general secretion pathway protein GspD, partial [Pirellulaceae bacterium]|nr:general secretion pathway protein GspD [Pirellulaceae bacterium]